MSVLLIYDTKSGVTKDITRLLVNKINHSVTVVSLDEIKTVDLDTFDRIILGAPIYMGYIIKSMRVFVVKHIETLLSKEIHLFTVGADETINLDKYLRLSYPAKLIDRAASKMHLGGEIRLETRRLLNKLIARQVMEEFQKTKQTIASIHHENIAAFAEAFNDTMDKAGDDRYAH